MGGFCHGMRGDMQMGVICLLLATAVVLVNGSKPKLSEERLRKVRRYWAAVNDKPEDAANNTCPQRFIGACYDKYDSQCTPCACCQTCSRCTTGTYFRDHVCDEGVNEYYSGFRCAA